MILPMMRFSSGWPGCGLVSASTISSTVMAKLGPCGPGGFGVGTAGVGAGGAGGAGAGGVGAGAAPHLEQAAKHFSPATALHSVSVPLGQAVWQREFASAKLVPQKLPPVGAGAGGAAAQVVLAKHFSPAKALHSASVPLGQGVWQREFASAKLEPQKSPPAATPGRPDESAVKNKRRRIDMADLAL